MLQPLKELLGAEGHLIKWLFAPGAAIDRFGAEVEGQVTLGKTYKARA